MNKLIAVATVAALAVTAAACAGTSGQIPDRQPTEASVAPMNQKRLAALLLTADSAPAGTKVTSFYDPAFASDPADATPYPGPPSCSDIVTGEGVVFDAGEDHARVLAALDVRPAEDWQGSEILLSYSSEQVAHQAMDQIRHMTIGCPQQSRLDGSETLTVASSPGPKLGDESAYVSSSGYFAGPPTLHMYSDAEIVRRGPVLIVIDESDTPISGPDELNTLMNSAYATFGAGLPQ